MSQGFSDADMSRLFERFGRSFHAGQRIYSAAEVAVECFILQAGTVRTFTSGDADRTLAVIEPGGIFGEECFLDEPRRTSHAEAVGDVKLLAIARPTLQALMTSAPVVATRFMRGMASRVSQLEFRAACTSETNETIRVVRALLRASANATPLELASYTALSIEAIHRTVDELVLGGFLLRAEDRLKIVSAPRLEELTRVLAAPAAWNGSAQ